MANILFIVFILLIGALYLNHLRKWYAAQKVMRDQLGDGYLHDELVMVHWRGYKLPMTYLEYLEVWVNMPEWHRKKLARNMESKIKAGKLPIMKHPKYKELQIIEDTTKSNVQIHPR